MATYSSILVWKIPWTEEPWQATQSMGSKVRHDWATEHTHSQLVHSYASLKVMWKYLLVQKMLHEMFS